ncbi:hypothetical protein A0H81_06277 [Grifola frondosa]|uniref:RING-type domain-containing protein n=1 Tax=Grifola frondosa TaxID=5627 RepID=A0A1C7MF70_GRIFR|nr:hypothetical protein A0H81_06277 [Grifola frondosa]
MPTCIVCLDTLKDPAALPCGHVFCHECIVRVIRTITPYTNQHFCPTCKHPYNIAQVDPALVPHHLRPHVSPSVRKLHLEYNIPSTMKSPSSSSECEMLRAENASLKTCCFVWRKRAAVHAAATLGLVGLARLARDHAIKMKQERDEIRTRYNALKIRYEEEMLISTFPPDRSPRPICPLTSAISLLIPSAVPPVSDDSYYSDCPDCQPMKRKREKSPERSCKRSNSTSPTISPLAPSAEVAVAKYLQGSLTLQ